MQCSLKGGAGKTEWGKKNSEGTPRESMFREEKAT